MNVTMSISMPFSLNTRSFRGGLYFKLSAGVAWNNDKESMNWFIFTIHIYQTYLWWGFGFDIETCAWLDAFAQIIFRRIDATVLRQRSINWCALQNTRHNIKQRMWRVCILDKGRCQGIIRRTRAMRLWLLICGTNLLKRSTWHRSVVLSRLNFRILISICCCAFMSPSIFIAGISRRTTIGRGYVRPFNINP